MTEISSLTFRHNEKIRIDKYLDYLVKHKFSFSYFVTHENIKIFVYTTSFISNTQKNL